MEIKAVVESELNSKFQKNDSPEKTKKNKKKSKRSKRSKDWKKILGNSLDVTA